MKNSLILLFILTSVIFILDSCSQCAPTVPPPSSLELAFFNKEILPGMEDEEDTVLLNEVMDTAFFLVFGVEVFPEVVTVIDEVIFDTATIDGVFTILDTTFITSEVDSFRLEINPEPLFSTTDSTSSRFLLPLDLRTSTIDGLFDAGYIFVEKTEGDGAQDTVIIEDFVGRVSDTILFEYDVNLQVIGPDCGFVEQLENLEITFHTFDSISVVSDRFIKDSTNIQIFTF